MISVTFVRCNTVVSCPLVKWARCLAETVSVSLSITLILYRGKLELYEICTGWCRLSDAFTVVRGLCSRRSTATLDVYSNSAQVVGLVDGGPSPPTVERVARGAPTAPRGRWLVIVAVDVASCTRVRLPSSCLCIVSLLLFSWCCVGRHPRSCAHSFRRDWFNVQKTDRIAVGLAVLPRSFNHRPDPSLSIRYGRN